MPSALVKLVGRLLVLLGFSNLLCLPMHHITLLVRPSLLILVITHMLPALRKQCSILMPIAKPSRDYLFFLASPQGARCISQVARNTNTSNILMERARGHNGPCMLSIMIPNLQRRQKRPKFCFIYIYNSSTYHWFSDSPKRLSENMSRHFSLSQCVCVVCRGGV